jgi:hypothetical protein
VLQKDETERGISRVFTLRLSFLAPFIFLSDLFFFFWGEIVLNVEGLADFFGSLSFNHVGNGLAGEVQERLDVQVVSSQDELEQGGLVNLTAMREKKKGRKNPQ